MKMDCIDSIDITANNKDVITISSDSFENFYIANIDDNGDEINYLICEDNITLFANFFMIKLLSDKNEGTIYSLQRLLKKKDIVKITINFKNGKKQDFELTKRRIAKNGMLENLYEDAYLDDNNNLCIMVTDKNIKYKKELFA
jgi:hypothetical protein